MVAAWKLSIPLTLLVASTSCIQTSNYLKTKVVAGNLNCSEPYTSNVLHVKVTKSTISCAKLCTFVENCRRLMFNKITKVCSLYDSGENCLIADSNVAATVCFRQKSTCDEINCSRCALGFYGDLCQYVITDCTDGRNKAVLPTTYLHVFIQTSPRSPILEVKCTPQVTVLLFRSAACNELNFNRSWQEYSVGFGHAQENYWIGLENIYNIRKRRTLVRLNFNVNSIWSGKRMTAMYKVFDMANKSQDYRITIGSYTNHPTKETDDAFTVPGFNINGRPFSTYDHDFSNNNCPIRFNSGWWYLDDPVCGLVNLNGKRSNVTSEANWFWIHKGTRKGDIKWLSLRMVG